MSEKVLLLLPKVPYPPTSGYSIKNLKLIEILSNHFFTHVVLLLSSVPDPLFLDILEKNRVSYKFFIKPKIFSYINALSHILDKKPIQVWYHYFSQIQKYLDDIVYDFDIIVTSGNIRMSEYIVKYKGIPKILDLSDLYSFGYRRNTNNTTSIPWKLIYKIESSRLYNYEKWLSNVYDKIFLFSNEEVEILKKNVNENAGKIERIAHGVDNYLFDYKKTNHLYKDSVVFLGKMNYQPNVDSVLWFCKDVLPLLPRNLNFVVVGAEPSRKIKRLSNIYPNVVVTGFVEDPFEILNSSCCLVAPMKTGTGIQNKVLQAMALGKICLVTDIAAKPIGGKHLEHFIVANSAEEFAYWIKEIAVNQDKYNYIGSNAKEYIKKNFTWDMYEKKMIQTIHELLHKCSKNPST